MKIAPMRSQMQSVSWRNQHFKGGVDQAHHDEDVISVVGSFYLPLFTSLLMLWIH